MAAGRVGRRRRRHRRTAEGRRRNGQRRPRGRVHGRRARRTERPRPRRRPGDRRALRHRVTASATSSRTGSRRATTDVAAAAGRPRRQRPRWPSSTRPWSSWPPTRSSPRPSAGAGRRGPRRRRPRRSSRPHALRRRLRVRAGDRCAPLGLTSHRGLRLRAEPGRAGQRPGRRRRRHGHPRDRPRRAGRALPLATRSATGTYSRPALSGIARCGTLSARPDPDGGHQPMRWKQPLLVGVTALGVALLAAACGGDNKGGGATTTGGRAPRPPPRRGAARREGPRRAAPRTTSGGSGGGKTSIAIGETLAPASLDISAQSGAAVPQALLYNVYETLVRIDDTGAFQPLLAKSYTTSADGLTWTFTLNDGITFANGDPLTSATVKATYDYNMANAKAPALIKSHVHPRRLRDGTRSHDGGDQAEAAQPRLPVQPGPDRRGRDRRRQPGHDRHHVQRQRTVRRRQLHHERLAGAEGQPQLLGPEAGAPERHVQVLLRCRTRSPTR